MKVKIENWGPIRNCEYDLNKSMVVTYGDNNIGKSYAMQLVYLYLKNIILYARRQLFHYRTFYFGNEDNSIIELVRQFYEDESKKEADITEDIVSIFSNQLEDEILSDLENSLKNTFGTYELILEKNPKITFEISDEISCIFYMKDRKITSKIKCKTVYLKRSNSNFHKSREGKNRFDIYVFDGNHISSAIALVDNKINDIKVLLAKAVLSRIQAVYFLPASRSGIYTGMSSFGPILAELSKNRAYTKGVFQIPNISEPISDYYMELSTIRQDHREYCEEIAEEIERKILKGTISYDNKMKTILYHGNDAVQSMEMKDVSSMVSEISPITAYLKYIVCPNAIYSRRMYNTEAIESAVMIFIEEPEAHLHPQNQVELIKIFTKLVKKNVKLFMASHSNYIFNELNNRVIAEDLGEKEYEPILMKYEDGQSNTICMNMDEFGVDDNNFQDVSAAIMEERELLLYNLVQKIDNQEEK